MIFHAEAIITPREGVLDTQGKAVENSTHRAKRSKKRLRTSATRGLRKSAWGA